MNSVELIGRLTKDPEVRYTSESQTAVAAFTIAIDRPTKDQEKKQADFPRITVFGRQAESCEKYLKRGRLVAIQGRLQTGSYQNKSGATVYTTDVVANRVEFIDWDSDQKEAATPQPKKEAKPIEPPEYEQMDFIAVDEDVPF